MAYSYLLSVVMGLPVVAVAFAMAGRQRRTMVAAGFYGCLLSPFSMLYDKRYWSPERIFGGGWGIEDLLFCFSAASVLWLAAVWPLRRRVIVAGVVDGSFALRAGGLFALGVGCFAAALLVGTGVLAATILADIALFAAIVAIRRELAWFGLRAAVVYTVYYFTFLLVLAAMAPGYMAVWDGPELLGPRICTVPVDELLWMFAFALAFPVAMAFNFDLRVVEYPSSIASNRDRG